MKFREIKGEAFVLGDSNILFKLGKGLKGYWIDDYLYPHICFEETKEKIGLFMNEPYTILWDNTIPKSKELKEQIKKEWERKKIALQKE